MRTTRLMTSPGRRPFLVVLLALALAGGALGVTSGVGPHGTKVAAESTDDDADSAPGGDAEESENAHSARSGYVHTDYVLVTGGDATAE